MILRVFVLLLLIFFYITFIEIPTQYNNHLDGNFVKNELIKYHKKKVCILQVLIKWII